MHTYPIKKINHYLTECKKNYHNKITTESDYNKKSSLVEFNITENEFVYTRKIFIKSIN